MRLIGKGGRLTCMVKLLTCMVKLLTCMVRVGLVCLKRMSHTLSVPFMLVVKNTLGRVGLQQPSVRYVVLYL